jgi:hypothetical protein
MRRNKEYCINVLNFSEFPSRGFGVKLAEIHECKPQSKRRAKRPSLIIASILITFILLGSGTYFLFFYKAPIKKVLLTSIAIAPNDTTETILSYNNEVFLKIRQAKSKKLTHLICMM